MAEELQLAATSPGDVEEDLGGAHENKYLKEKYDKRICSGPRGWHGYYIFAVELLFLAMIVLVSCAEPLGPLLPSRIFTIVRAVLGFSWLAWAILMALVGILCVITFSLPEKESPLLNAVNAQHEAVVHRLLGQPLDEAAADAAKTLEEKNDENKAEKKTAEAEIDDIDYQWKAAERELHEKFKEKRQRQHQLRERVGELDREIRYAGLAKEVTPKAIAAATKAPAAGAQSLVPCIGWMLVRKSPLIPAIRSRKPELVQALLDAGHSPNRGNSMLLGFGYNESPLHAALESVPTLDRHGSEKEKLKSSMEIVGKLLAAGANPRVGFSVGPFGSLYNMTPLYNAVGGDDGSNQHKLELLEVLLSMGADPNEGTSVLPFGLLHKETPLAKAVSGDSVSQMRLLLDRGAWTSGTYNVGPLGLLGRVTLVRLAACENSYKAMKILLDKGASPNVGYTVGPLALLGSSSPISTAAEKGHCEVADALLEKGAWANYGWTLGPFGVLSAGSPMFMSAQQARHSGKPEAACMPALLKAGAWRNLGRRVGCGALAAQSPMFTAAESGHCSALKMLLDGGANASVGFRILCSTVARPLEWANAKGRTEAADLLRDAGH